MHACNQWVTTPEYAMLQASGYKPTRCQDVLGLVGPMLDSKYALSNTRSPSMLVWPHSLTSYNVQYTEQNTGKHTKLYAVSSPGLCHGQCTACISRCQSLTPDMPERRLLQEPSLQMKCCSVMNECN